MRHLLVTLASLCLLLLPRLASAQSPAPPSTKMAKIGILGVFPPTTTEGMRLGFLETLLNGLEERGHRLDETFTLVGRYSEGEPQRMEALAKELLAESPDLLVAHGSGATYSLRGATTTIPVVMVGVSDPQVIEAAAQPDSNVTGISSQLKDQNEPQLRLIREILPRASRVAVLHNPNDPISLVTLTGAQEAAKSLGLSIEPVAVRDDGDAHTSMMTIAARRPDAVQVHSTPVLFPHLARISRITTNLGIVTIGGNRGFAEDGLLVSYAPSVNGLWYQAAPFVDKILKGAKPSSLPVEPARKYELVLNAGTAEAMGVKLPEAVVKRADLVIR